MRKPAFCICETKTQISFAVTAKLISAFVFATRIVQSLYFIYTKFPASSYLLWLYSPVCVGPGRKPRRPVFSQRGSSDGSSEGAKLSVLVESILHLVFCVTLLSLSGIDVATCDQDQCAMWRLYLVYIRCLQHLKMCSETCYHLCLGKHQDNMSV